MNKYLDNLNEVKEILEKALDDNEYIEDNYNDVYSALDGLDSSIGQMEAYVAHFN